MKSAYELALEKSGGLSREYTDEQKEQLADIDRIYDAKLAQVRFDNKARQREAQANPDVLNQLNEDLAIEIRSIEARREREKEKLRETFDQENGE